MATNKEQIQLTSMMKTRISADSKTIIESNMIAGNSIYSKLYQDIINAQKAFLTAIQA